MNIQPRCGYIIKSYRPLIEFALAEAALSINGKGIISNFIGTVKDIILSQRQS